MSCVYRNIPHIVTPHHFRFESKRPRKVFLKEFLIAQRTVDLCNPETALVLVKYIHFCCFVFDYQYRLYILSLAHRH